jgi:Ca-activated chloride channel family protein
VPFVFTVLWWSRRAAERRLADFVDLPLHEEIAGRLPRGRRMVRSLLRLTALSLLVLAAARPQWGASEVEVEQEGIDLVVALDISRSMLAEDIQPTRLGRAKVELSDLIESMRGDRVGLVFFAGASFPQSPLTVDAAAARLFLSQADPDMIQAQGTDIGSALETAVSLFTEESGRTRVILLVTDGEDFAGLFEGVSAELQRRSIALYAVGMGTAEGAPIPNFDELGRRAGFVRDETGAVVISRLEESALIDLVQKTGGLYARAGSAGLDLARLRGELQSLEGGALRSQRVVNYQDRYPLPLGAALFLLLLEPWFRDGRRRRT